MVNYNWKERNFPSRKIDWEKFESNKKSMTLHVLFARNDKEEEIKQEYISKSNFNLEKKKKLF